MSTQVVKTWAGRRGSNESMRLLNTFGVTEAAVYQTAFEYDRSEEVMPRVAGTPFNNVDIHIDGSGEIWVGGPQVCKGYWNRPDLNRGKFFFFDLSLEHEEEQGKHDVVPSWMLAKVKHARAAWALLPNKARRTMRWFRTGDRSYFLLGLSIFGVFILSLASDVHSRQGKVGSCWLSP